MFKGQNSSVACPRVSYGIWPLCLFSIAMYRAHFTLEASRPRSSVLENKAFGHFCLLLSKKRIWSVLKWLRISWFSVYVLRSLSDLVHHPGTCNAKLDVLAVSLSKNARRFSLSKSVHVCDLSLREGTRFRVSPEVGRVVSEALIEAHGLSDRRNTRWRYM